MRSTWCLSAAALAVMGISCATSEGDDQARPAPGADTARARRGLDPGWRPGSMPVKVGDDHAGGEEMALEGGRGQLDQREVDAVLATHLRELVACADQAGPARRYLAGDVALRFFVTSEGEVSNVLVLSSAVGNFAVERCLVEAGRRIHLPRPRGHKGTDFQYSLQFRPSGEAAVVDWGKEKVAREVAQLSPRLAPCGELGPAPVQAVLYIEPGGAVGSVGLASEGPFDVDAATCAVDQIRRWKLRDDRHHVVRTSFPVVTTGKAAAPASAPAPRERLVKRVSRRRSR
jgi:hypothetical protein